MENTADKKKRPRVKYITDGKTLEISYRAATKKNASLSIKIVLQKYRVVLRICEDLSAIYRHTNVVHQPLIY